jgi:hypothetical protein
MRNIRPTVSTLIFLAIIGQTLANDSSYYASGNQIIPLQETDISVKKEVLTIKRINDEKVSITVDYTFHNPTKEKTILMGFEAKAPYGDVNGTPRKGEHPYIENFSVSFNGKNAPHKVTILPPNFVKTRKGEQFYTINDLKKQLPIPDIENTNETNLFYVYHFPATFAPGDTSIIHTYDYSISSSVFTATIDYLLTPALRWANQQIDDFTLIIDLGEFQQYHISPTFFENTDAWKTQGRVKIGMEQVIHDLTAEKSRELTVWQHHGSVTFHAKNFKPKGELIIYENIILNQETVLDSKTIKMSLQDLPMLGDMELKDEFTRKVLENYPYARRGYVFKNAELKAFYEKQPWYMPDPAYKEASVTKEETEWLKAVRALKVAN